MEDEKDHQDIDVGKDNTDINDGKDQAES